MLDVKAAGQVTPNVDRTYTINPWPGMSGLYYQISLSEYSWTQLMNDSAGCGAIRYIQTPDGRIIRVDSFLIPLSELSKQLSDKIRLCYWGYSPQPALTVNSAGYDSGVKSYYSYNIPHASYQEYVFTAGAGLALECVPDGRQDAALDMPRHPEPMPKPGDIAPARASASPHQ